MDQLRDIYPAEVLDELRQSAMACRQDGRDREAELLETRLDVLTSCGPNPRRDYELHEVVRWRRAVRAAWDTYVDSAASCGLFDDGAGDELLARLRGRDHVAFRSALSECMVCWLLVGPFGFHVESKPLGAPGKTLDLLARCPTAELRIEVKTTFQEKSRGWFRRDHQEIARPLNAAKDQFESGPMNLLAVVARLAIDTDLRPRLLDDRDEVVRGFIAESYIAQRMNMATGEPIGPVEFPLKPGRFLRIPPGGAGDASDVDHVGGVICIEERVVRHPDLRENAWVGHEILVAHNPWGRPPIPENLWGECPQLVLRDGAVIWSDGYPIHP